MSEQDFQGKVCVITGGTQGVGEAVARTMAARGASGIVITGRHRQRGELVRDSIAESGVRCLFVPASLESATECQTVIPAADKEFGAVDVLVNAAATTKRGSIVDSSSEDIDEILFTNVRAPMLLMRDAINIMRREKRGGSIVNVSSVVATGGPDILCGYSASKAALNAITINAAYAVVRDRIRVNAIAPGEIDTPGQHAVRTGYHGESEDWLTHVESLQPFGRLIKVDELARAIAFLAGPQSGLMTGSIVHFDQSIPGAGDPPIPRG